MLSDGKSAGGHIVTAILYDPVVEEAVKLHGNQPTWSQIYDIIDFIGGPEQIHRAGWADRKRTRLVRQTANCNRHLGSPKKYPSPPTVVALNDARIFVRELMMKWISSRLSLIRPSNAAEKKVIKLWKRPGA
jgi:hypothetical protein